MLLLNSNTQLDLVEWTTKEKIEPLLLKPLDSNEYI